MLTLSHVSKSYGKFPAVEDISLEMEHGLYGMLAPNGAGKTTLIKMIATLLVPTQGEILWDGIPVAKLGDVREDGVAALIEELWFDGPRAEPSGKDFGSAWGNIESAGGSL